MDAIDQQIIALLASDARLSATEIGRRVHRSRAAVKNRIDALLASGEIAGFGLRLRPRPCPVLFEIGLRPSCTCDALVPRLRKQLVLRQAWSVTGASDLFVWVEADTAEEIHRLRSLLVAQPEVAGVTTHVVCRTFD